MDEEAGVRREGVKSGRLLHLVWRIFKAQNHFKCQLFCQGVFKVYLLILPLRPRLPWRIPSRTPTGFDSRREFKHGRIDILEHNLELGKGR